MDRIQLLIIYIYAYTHNANGDNPLLKVGIHEPTYQYNFPILECEVKSAIKTLYIVRCIIVYIYSNL